MKHSKLLQTFAWVALLLLGVGTLQADDEIYTKVDEFPVPMKTPPPDYPDALRRDGITGMVAVMLVIDEKGHVVEASATKSTNEGFVEPSLDAVRRWRFKPGKIDGKAVKTKVVIPLKFTDNS